jgi:peptidyl-prolyl cis-trans isomerase SurA
LPILQLLNMRVRFALLLLISTIGFGQNKKKETERSPLVFRVHKQPVFADEFIYLYKKNHTKPEDFKEAKINEYLQLLINFKLKIEEAKSRGMDTTKAFVKEFSGYKEELKKPYQVGGDELDRLTKQAYERLKEEVKASHILVNVAVDASPEDTIKAFQKISAIRQRIINGEDFQKLASELSEDPSAKGNAGDLGYFTTMQMVFPFETAAYNLKPFEVSNPVRSRFGYHLIKLYDRQPARGEVEISHILLRSENNDSKIKSKIFEIYDQLKAGKSWDELCLEFSEDANTKNVGGRLRPFGIGALASVPEFEQMAFSMQKEGEISDPFQSNIGWHIIRLEKKIPLPPYKDVEASLKKKVARDERMQISKQALMVKKRKDFAFTENTETKNLLLPLADSSIIKAKWVFSGDAPSLSLPIFSLQGKATTLGDFVKYVKSHQTISSLSPKARLTELYESFVEEKINQLEDEKIYNENPDYRNLLVEYKEGIILFEIMEKEVWNKASKDSVGQRNFYDLHKEKYKAGDRLEAQVFAALEKKQLDELQRKISAGDTIKKSDLKKFKSVMSVKAYEKGESKVIDRISWVTGLQETQIDNVFYLVDVKRLVPPGYKTFEEARASVISEYQDLLEKTWLETLKKKYKVELANKGKKYVIEKLVK